MRVVVLFETVDIRQQDRERAPQPPRPLHLAGKRPHEVAAIVEAGQGIGERQLLQLPLTLFLSQARHEGIERPRQVPDLPAAAGGELDRQVPGGHAPRGFTEALERSRDERPRDERQQPHAEQQRDQEEHRPEPQHSGLAHRFGTRRFGDGCPA